MRHLIVILLTVTLYACQKTPVYFKGQKLEQTDSLEYTVTRFESYKIYEPRMKEIINFGVLMQVLSVYNNVTDTGNVSYFFKGNLVESYQLRYQKIEGVYSAYDMLGMNLLNYSAYFRKGKLSGDFYHYNPNKPEAIRVLYNKGKVVKDYGLVKTTGIKYHQVPDTGKRKK